jgi:hypothetical protein
MLFEDKETLNPWATLGMKRDIYISYFRESFANTLFCFLRKIRENNVDNADYDFTPF